VCYWRLRRKRPGNGNLHRLREKLKKTRRVPAVRCPSQIPRGGAVLGEFLNIEKCNGSTILQATGQFEVIGKNEEEQRSKAPG